MFGILQRRTNTFKLSRHLSITTARYGYIVLVPEIGEDAHAAEGILKPEDSLPAFNDITIERCLAAIGHQATAVENKVKDIESAIGKSDGNTNVSETFRELDEVTGPLDTTWGIAKALYLGNSTLIPTKSYMNIHERARRARACKYTSRNIFNALNTHCSQITNGEEDAVLKRLKDKYIIEGKLNGLTLADDQMNGLKAVLSKLSAERTTFRNKVDVAIRSFSHRISDYNMVRDFPTILLEATAKDPSAATQGPWKITLQPQILDGFLKYCPDRTQRWNVWQANVRKASIQMEKSLETSTHIEIIRAHRKQQANILGFPTFADMSMQTKMVGSVDRIKEVFAKLLHYAGPAQSLEIDELQRFAVENGFQHKLDLYDVPYWQRKYLLNQHSTSEESLRQYFPLPKVMEGLFALAEKLISLKIVERQDTEVWQPTVRYFDVYDCDGESEEAVGGFYLDCYSKENKYGRNNSWMVNIRNRNKAAAMGKPLCALIFNFTPPISGRPYLLNMDDLQMVFKTFGSAMQHLLTKADFSDLAGLSNIEWDASQVAGYVMANLLDRKDTLKMVSCHVSSNEQLSDILATNAKLFKTKLAGYSLCHDLYLAHLDLELHQCTEFWLNVVRRLWPVYHCIPLDKKDAHPCSMTEIFSGDWAAAQFSHLYSKVIAADISDGIQQSADLQMVGKRFKETFLSAGGSMPAAEVFRRFRGRDPSVEALLKSLKLLESSNRTLDTI